MNDIRDLLHGLNNELSIAVLELELLLERGGMEDESRESLLRALDACRRAAVGVRQGWAVLGAHGVPPPDPGLSLTEGEA